jgi:hypothetical protein
LPKPIKMEKKDINKSIVETIRSKSILKHNVYDNTLTVFIMLKTILTELATTFNKRLTGSDKRVMMEYKDMGLFDAQLKVSGDLLIFHMHSNVFEFDRGHGIWKTSYIQADKTASYCGIINIFNFLSDSVKYKRLEDLGYLIGRIFINKDMHYFVEGKRQLGYFYNNFGKDVIDHEALRNIIKLAIQYTLEFDLLVPPYDAVKMVTVDLITQKIQFSKLKTGKRLGFQFNADDISGEEN